MGRRKVRRLTAQRKKEMPLETQFMCPFCNHEKSCEVKM